MKAKEKNNKKGISLIVLVITIIVIIILAVAVILSIANNNPIENAKKASFLNDLKTIQEEVTLHIANEYANKNGNYDPSTDTGIQDIINKYNNYKDKIQIVEGKVVLDGGKATEQESNWAKENGITVKEQYPVIPVGFSYKEGTVENGYVIQNDTDFNEFVWVPVEDISQFVREDGYEDGTIQTYVSSGDATEPYTGSGASASEVSEYNAMVASVKKYKGFYIARYEASNNGSGVAQSKKDKPSWSDIPWGTSMTDLSGGAVEKSRAVYPNSDKADDSKYAVSTLCYGVQWDATIRWLEKNYPGIAQDSSEYGNYKPSTGSGRPINTGSNENYKTNNIYDMCGNIYEWTMESLSGNYRIYRGGYYGPSGTFCPVSLRSSYYYPDYNSAAVGFRFTLYIK